MQLIVNLVNQAHSILDKSKSADFLAPLALRLYLAPIMIVAGLHKFNHFEDIVGWFQYGLELPLPSLMAFLAASAELFGGLALLIGFATRWASIPLMVTMLVAAFSAHWNNGWFAIAPSNGETSTAYVLEMVGFPGASESLENSEAVATRLKKAKSILKENGNYSWLTEKGGVVILNNGIEFAATYFIMLMVLFFYGAGNYLSADYWIAKKFRNSSA
jgi:uncharacterized membrane protein YphA (DoxX/SURF4 family)